MEKDDIYTSIGTAISAVSAAISWIWNIPFLQFFCTFILGSLVTYFIQTRLQNRSEKRKITREKIEKIYGPLYVELQDIRETLNDKLSASPHSMIAPNGTEPLPLLEQIETYPEYFSIPLQLRKDIDFVDNHSKCLEESLWDVTHITESHVVRLGNTIFQNHIKQEWDRLSDNQQGFLGIRYESEMYRTLSYKSLIDQIILNQDPIKDIKQSFPDFTPANCTLEMMVERDNPRSSKRVSVRLTRGEEEIHKLLELAKKVVQEEKKVQKFLELRRELFEKIDTLLPTIRKHIEKHYPIEKI